jgi:hypothetical protein
MLVTVTASLTGRIEDVIWYEGERVRHSLGYDYCGYPAHLLLFMTMLWIGIREKLRLPEMGFLLILNALIYYLTDSRTDFYLVILGILGAGIWCMECSNRFLCSLRAILTKYGFWIAAAASIALHILYGTTKVSVLVKLNALLNSRLSLGYAALCQYGISLFGQKIRWIGQGSLKADPTKVYNYVDCAFLKDLLTFGLLFIILLGIGYWILGKRILASGKQVYGWIVLISLAYAVINAHLCMPAFNGCFLLLGCCFAEPGGARATEQCRSFEAALGTLVPKGPGRQTKRALRMLLLFVWLLLLVFLQRQENSTVVSGAQMVIWATALLILVLSALCYEASDKPGLRKSALYRCVWLFLAAVLIVDFAVSRKFRYAGFAMLAFGGLLCRSWHSMEKPEELLEEFVWAYQLLFWLNSAAIAGKVLLHSGSAGAGLFANVQTCVSFSLIALAVFIGALRWPKRRWLAGIGAVAALLYLGWCWITLAPSNVLDWIYDTLRRNWWLCRAYLKQGNLLGHSYLLKHNGTKQWAANSIVMTMYRYGIPAGLAYCAVLAAGLLRALRDVWKNHRWFPFLAVAAAAAVSMVTVTELPFCTLPWGILWFSVCWYLVVDL